MSVKQHLAYSPQEMVLFKDVFNEAVAMLPLRQRSSAAKALLAQKILLCASKGERDPSRLRLAAFLEWKTDYAVALPFG
jgi:hypothetical protein